jgi:hypothetical protein
LVALIDRYQPDGDAEAADIQRVRALLEAAADPYRRDLPLHVTASALIVHPPTGRVLLRWHQRQQAWLQVGGHGDPGETDPLAIGRDERAAQIDACCNRHRLEGVEGTVQGRDTMFRVFVNVDTGNANAGSIGSSGGGIDRSSL